MIASYRINEEARSKQWWCYLSRHRIFNRARILCAFGSIENLHADDVPILIVIKNDARLVLIALFDRNAGEKNPQHIHLWVVGYFHDCLRYFLIFFVR